MAILYPPATGRQMSLLLLSVHIIKSLTLPSHKNTFLSSLREPFHLGPGDWNALVSNLFAMNKRKHSIEIKSVDS